MKSLLLVCAAAALVTGCGASQVKVMGAEDPEYKATQRPDPAAVPHAHNDSTIELPSDEQIVEPDHPAVGSTQERALVHIHAPKAVCSGVVIGPRLILTAHQCVAPDARAAHVAVGVHRVEVASSTLTWTNREASHVIVPACEWSKLDLAVIILKEPVEWVQPLKVTSAPGPGGGVQALGFGKCVGETRSVHERTGAVLSTEDDAVVIDVPLCRGDVGGPVVERATSDLVGVISHQDDPDGSPRRTTTIVRFDTAATKALVAQAAAILKGGDPSKLAPLACQ